MIAQYAAAALVNECQVLAASRPAPASIPTSAGMEDFNSMGAFAALKARTVAGHAAHVVATELVCACQGLEFHRPLRSTDALEGRVLLAVRGLVPRLEEDRSLAAELDGLARALRTGALVLAGASTPPGYNRRRARLRRLQTAAASPASSGSRDRSVASRRWSTRTATASTCSRRSRPCRPRSTRSRSACWTSTPTLCGGGRGPGAARRAHRGDDGRYRAPAESLI